VSDQPSRTEPFARRTRTWKLTLPERLIRHRLPQTEPGVGLTFDDGPDPAVTPQVLDRLAEHGVQATFFVLGRSARRHPELLRRIRDERHLIGNHSFAHPAFGTWDYRIARAEILACQHAVEDAVGESPREYRAPFGRLAPGALLAVFSMGLKAVNWSLDSGDWRCRSEADAVRCAGETAALIRPRDILLFHDNHFWIATILDRLLPCLAGLAFQAPNPATDVPTSST
jgi:peptidoglycan/xylan/chitin deacetylase (PgdA/CDA1 family)